MNPNKTITQDQLIAELKQQVAFQEALIRTLLSPPTTSISEAELISEVESQ